MLSLLIMFILFIITAIWVTLSIKGRNKVSNYYFFILNKKNLLKNFIKKISYFLSLKNFLFFQNFYKNKNNLTLFNFGSYKQSYFQTWWKNYKLRQNWIWKWRN